MKPQLELAQFIVRAKRLQYGQELILAGGSRSNAKELRVFDRQEDGETSFIFMDERYEYRQTLWGGRPFRLMEMVFLREKPCEGPVWLLELTGTFLFPLHECPEVSHFLRQALAHVPERLPARGPAQYSNKCRMFNYEHRVHHQALRNQEAKTDSPRSWTGYDKIYGLCHQYPLYYGEYSAVLKHHLPATKLALCAT